MTRFSRLLVAFGAALFATPTLAVDKAADSLTGTWVLVAADVIRPDGSRTHDYGEAPKGLFIVDAKGNYGVQIYDSSHTHFVSGDKLKGTPDEYREALLKASTHFGTLEVDTAKHVITMRQQYSSYPNQDSGVQVRRYELKGDILSYRVPPRPDGGVPISIWKRLR